AAADAQCSIGIADRCSAGSLEPKRADDASGAEALRPVADIDRAPQSRREADDRAARRLDAAAPALEADRSAAPCQCRPTEILLRGQSDSSTARGNLKVDRCLNRRLVVARPVADWAEPPGKERAGAPGAPGARRTP